MAKSKNHTSHNQKRKAHRRGIKKAHRPRRGHVSARGMNQRFVRNQKYAKEGTNLAKRPGRPWDGSAFGPYECLFYDHLSYEEETETVEEQRCFQQQYNFIEPLARTGSFGEFGTTYQMRNVRTGQLAAWKKKEIDVHGDGIGTTHIREISILQRLRHRNIVQMLDVFFGARSVFMVLEWAEGNLQALIWSSRPGLLEPVVIKSLGHQLCTGIQHCHVNGVLHRDLKPANIRINSDGCLKLSGFDISRSYSPHENSNYTPEVVTLFYRPLEILLGLPCYSTPADMWSVGCILAQMASGQILFLNGDSEIGMIFDIFRLLGTPSQEQWAGLAECAHFKASFPKFEARGWQSLPSIQAQLGPDGLELLAGLLAYDPARRTSAGQALSHAYFEGGARQVPVPARLLRAPRVA